MSLQLMNKWQIIVTRGTPPPGNFHFIRGLLRYTSIFCHEIFRPLAGCQGGLGSAHTAHPKGNVSPHRLALASLGGTMGAHPLVLGTVLTSPSSGSQDAAFLALSLSD